MVSLQNFKLFSEGKEVGMEALKTEITKKPQDSHTLLPAPPSSPGGAGRAVSRGRGGDEGSRCSWIPHTLLGQGEGGRRG